MLSGEEAGRAISGCFTVVIVAVILSVMGAAAVGVWIGHHTASQEQQQSR